METTLNHFGRNRYNVEGIYFVQRTPIIMSNQSKKLQYYEEDACVKLLYKYLKKKNQRQAIRCSYVKNYINKDEIKLREMKEHSKHIMGSILGVKSTPHSNSLAHKLSNLSKSKMKFTNNIMISSLSNEAEKTPTTGFSALKRSVASINSENCPQFKKIKIGDKVVLKKISKMKNNIKNHKSELEVLESSSTSPLQKNESIKQFKTFDKDPGLPKPPMGGAIYSFQRNYTSGYCSSISEIIKKRRAERNKLNNNFSSSLKI